MPEPLLAPIPSSPRFDIIDVHRPSAAALTVGMAVSILMFAAFTHRLQEEPLAKALASLSGRLWREQTPPRIAPRSSRPSPTLVEARHELVAAIAANLKERYHDRAMGHHLADAILAQDESGAYDSLDTGPSLAARLNTDIQNTLRPLDVPRGRSSPTWSTSRRRRRRARRRR